MSKFEIARITKRLKKAQMRLSKHPMDSKKYNHEMMMANRMAALLLDGAF